MQQQNFKSSLKEPPKRATVTAVEVDFTPIFPKQASNLRNVVPSRPPQVRAKSRLVSGFNSKRLMRDTEKHRIEGPYEGRLPSHKPSIERFDNSGGRYRTEQEQFAASHHFDVNSSSTTRLSKNPTKSKIHTLLGSVSSGVRDIQLYETKAYGSFASKYLTELQSQREGESSLRTADHMTSFMCSKFDSSPEVIRFEGLAKEEQSPKKIAEERKIGKKKKRIIAARGHAKKYNLK